MTTPRTSRQCAYKTFCVFFGFGGKYSGCYAELQAQSLEKAQRAAWAQYGHQEVRMVTAKDEAAESRVAAFRLKRI